MAAVSTSSASCSILSKGVFALAFRLGSAHNPPNCGGVSHAAAHRVLRYRSGSGRCGVSGLSGPRTLLHRGIYNEASWVEGKPWQVGSRLRYVIVQPVCTTVSAVVTSISPHRTISLINHALGVTTEQNVTFGPDPKGRNTCPHDYGLCGQIDGVIRKRRP